MQFWYRVTTAEGSEAVLADPGLSFSVGSLAVRAGYFFQHVFHYFGLAVGMQFVAHAAQRHADDVAVVELRARPHAAELQPEAMRQVDVFGPETRRVRAEVEEHHVLLIFEHDFEGNRRPGLGQLFP